MCAKFWDSTNQEKKLFGNVWKNISYLFSPINWCWQVPQNVILNQIISRHGLILNQSIDKLGKFINSQVSILVLSDSVSVLTTCGFLIMFFNEFHVTFPYRSTLLSVSNYKVVKIFMGSNSNYCVIMNSHVENYIWILKLLQYCFHDPSYSRNSISDLK